VEEVLYLSEIQQMNVFSRFSIKYFMNGGKILREIKTRTCTIFSPNFPWQLQTLLQCM